jgi:hypothetical protein
MGVSDKDLETLLIAIAENPLAGSVIPGLGGIRKLRFGFGGRGKRGGGRVIYFLQLEADVSILLFAYAKSGQEDLDTDEKKAVLAALNGVLND